MGIKGLEKFIRTSNTNIFEEIDIRREIAKWRSGHRSNPTIMIDVKEVVKFSCKIDEGGLVLGGRYQKISEILDYFFCEIKKANADLAFFIRLDEGRHEDVDQFQPIFPAYDGIIRNKSLKCEGSGRMHKQMDCTSELRPTERILYNFMHSICSKYGQVYIDYGLRVRGILAFARENRKNVMCLITRNTRFLVFERDFEYWSLSDVQFCEMKIAKFSRQKLKEIIELNVEQMQLLHAITQLEMDVSNRLIGGHDKRNRFHKICDYVKKQEYRPNGYESSQLTGDLTEEQRNLVEKRLASAMTANNYAGNWTDDIHDGLILDLVNNDESFNLVLQFCKANLYFAYKLMNEKLTIQKDLLFIDIRRPDALPFIDLVISVTMKLCGIIFKDVEPDKQPKTRAVKIKRIFEEESVESEVDIEYPTLALPSLQELLIAEQDKSFDQFRWALLQWLLDLSEETISKINGSKKQLRVVLLTLNFLLSHQIISPHEADVLLLTELDGRSKGNVYVPRNCPPPPMPNTRVSNYVDVSWIQTAHKYTIAYELVCHCLELSGLRTEPDNIELDACKFHDNINLVENGNDTEKIERLMAQIKGIRLW
ncbi:uncharacterized protein LOC129569461 [Sitodiplosis mosellana]|uniref:uncharacterized protein LOC129569461 n=1 Tax=Sitodiplosis mosellana TaxID=263140 RepID=UPI00244504A4|nr:uncharacterized protein LOC129569461 [Sitodiplosis mosellana]